MRQPFYLRDVGMPARAEQPDFSQPVGVLCHGVPQDRGLAYARGSFEDYAEPGLSQRHPEYLEITGLDEGQSGHAGEFEHIPEVLCLPAGTARLAPTPRGSSLQEVLDDNAEAVGH